MNKLHKIGDWFWLNKERVFFVILFIILCYRAYTVFSSSDEEESSAITVPAAAETASNDDDGRSGRSGASGGSTAAAAPATGGMPRFKNHLPPKRFDINNMPSEEEWPVEKGRPPEPPAAPLPPTQTPFQSLVSNNPFSAVGGGSGGPSKSGEDRPNIQLLRISPWNDGTYRAEIKTNTRKRYAEGEEFETYRLVQIDPENNSVVIYSEKHAKEFTYKVNP